MSNQYESHIDAKTFLGGVFLILSLAAVTFSFNYFSEEKKLNLFKETLGMHEGLVSYEKYHSLTDERAGKPIERGYFPHILTECMLGGKPSVDRWPSVDGKNTIQGYYKIALQSGPLILEVRQHKGINTDWLYFSPWQREPYSYKNFGFSAISKCRGISRVLKYNKRL